MENQRLLTMDEVPVAPAAAAESCIRLPRLGLCQLCPLSLPGPPSSLSLMDRPVMAWKEGAQQSPLLKLAA